MIPVGNQEEMLFFPYNAIEDDLGQPDRVYDSQDFADYFRQFIGNGVYPNPSNGLKVESLNNSKVLTIRAGSAFINGRTYVQSKDFDFTIDNPHLTLGRRDIVICRHDIIARTMQVFYVAGTPAATPQFPTIVRNSDIYDLKLCEIVVGPNVTAITQGNITDTRLNSAVCGIVAGVVDQVDTTDIFDQYQSYLDGRVYDWNVLFNDFEEFQEQQKDQARDLLTMLETQSFTLVNNSFDDTSTKRGCTYTSTFINGVKHEEIKVRATNMLLAERDTEFIDGEKIVVINFYVWQLIEGNNTFKTTRFTMTEKTKFVNGTRILEVI